MESNIQQCNRANKRPTTIYLPYSLSLFSHLLVNLHLYEWPYHAMQCRDMQSSTHSHTRTFILWVMIYCLFVCLQLNGSRLTSSFIHFFSFHFSFSPSSFSNTIFLFPLIHSAIETDVVIWYGRKLKFNYQMHSLSGMWMDRMVYNAYDSYTLLFQILQ